MTLSTHSLIHILVVSNPFPPYTPFVSLTSRPIFLCFDFPHPPFSKSGLLSQKRPIFSEKREKKKWKKKKTVNSAGFPTPFFPPGESHSISSSFLILYRFFVFADPDASERQEEKKGPGVRQLTEKGDARGETVIKKNGAKMRSTAGEKPKFGRQKNNL